MVDNTPHRYKSILFICFILFSTPLVKGQKLKAFAEFGSSIYTGDRIPLWQVSLQHGFSSLNNNVYLRGGAFYKDTINSFRLNGGIDLGVAAGFKSAVMLQQAYADVRYKWIGLWAGCREIEAPLLNKELTSGGLTWSGNVRPIPQITIGVLDYIHILPWLQFKAELSYGWFSDGVYQRKNVGKEYSYVKKIKYHHKSFFLRLQKPLSSWIFDIGMVIDDQFGGYRVEADRNVIIDLGNRPKDYLNALLPRNGGEGAYFEGNYLGSEHLRLTYQNENFSISAYLENYFDDLSGMGKQNGLDGLWGIEFNANRRQAINGLVLEYFQSTHQSGPMHGVDFSVVDKTGGADDYYNHYAYPGWSHWGMSIGTPLIASPIYNDNGNLAFLYNRVKAIHLGWKGDIAQEWSYRAKLTFNRTWGTPFKPSIDILDNFSTFVEVKYLPQKWINWSLLASMGFDIGDLYGDNLGFQIKIRKEF